MKNKIFELRVPCNDENIANILIEKFAIIELYPSFSQNAEKNSGMILFYFEETVQLNDASIKIKEVLKHYQLFFEILPVKREDWAESWKKYFHVQQVSKRFIIKPSWENYQVKENEVVIQIDPGMSFGTGLHGTTRACLKFIDNFQNQRQDENLSMIDVGCGSGILSIGALHLGYNLVDAFDYDDIAIGITAKNLLINNIKANNLFSMDLFEYKVNQKYDLVVVNILPQVLVPNADKIVSMASEGGQIVLAGILTDLFEEVIDNFIKKGCFLKEKITIEGWTSGILNI